MASALFKHARYTPLATLRPSSSWPFLTFFFPHADDFPEITTFVSETERAFSLGIHSFPSSVGFKEGLEDLVISGTDVSYQRPMEFKERKKTNHVEFKEGLEELFTSAGWCQVRSGEVSGCRSGSKSGARILIPLVQGV